MKLFSILFLIILITFIAACNKDTFTTKPQISLKKISNTTLTRGQNLNIEIEFTDAEGDIQDTIWYKRISRTCPSEAGVKADDKFKIPDFETTKNQRGSFEFSFIYGTLQSGSIFLNTCSNKSDTSYFKFWMKDKAKNFSDTISTPNIIFVR